MPVAAGSRPRPDGSALRRSRRWCPGPPPDAPDPTARRRPPTRSAHSSSTTARWPACTVAWRLSGGVWRSKNQPPRSARASPSAKVSTAPSSGSPPKAKTVASGAPRRASPGVSTMVDRHHGRSHVGVLGQPQVAVAAEVVEDGPAGGDGPGRPGAGHRRRAVEPAQPVGGHERLQPGQLAVPVDDHRDPLGGVAVLVEVGGDRGHPGHRQVPLLVQVAQSAEEGEDEAPEAGVDMAEDPPFGGQGGQRRGSGR